MSRPPSVSRGAFRPLRLTTTTTPPEPYHERVAISPLDVKEVTPTRIDGVSCLKRRADGPLWIVGSVEDVTLAWQRALRADDTPSPCEWTLAVPAFPSPP